MIAAFVVLAVAAVVGICGLVLLAAALVSEVLWHLRRRRRHDHRPW